ncbi:MAG TPA: aromatic amino acid ammonia-lyase [Kiloniellales bacterium]|nr:aromatic amino acid ammonia-lyase [Kiloniellales bacterium]
MTGPLLLTGSDLTPSVLREVAFDRRPVALTPDAAQRAAVGRALVERALAKGDTVYGLTTGLGSRVGHRLNADDLADFSARTVRGRAHGVGPPLAAPLVRAMMVARLNVLLNGGAGVSFALIELLRDMLNADLRPVVPSIGSVGAGDLCLMAHLGLVMIGEGEAEHGRRRGPAAALLLEAGLRPVTLGPKDGLGLINCSALGAGIAGVALEEADAIYRAAQVAAALTFEGFRANLSPIDPEAVAARPQPGQAVASAHLRRLLFGSLLLEPGGARRVQDPISLRCVGAVHGALLAALGFAERALDPELNGAAENPVLLLESERVISTGNFHTPLLALSLDQVALASAQVAANALARGSRLMQERFSGLPNNLIARDAGYSGFAPVMKVGEALLGEIRHLAQPVSGDIRWGADGTEDDVTNTPFAAKKLLELLERLRHLLALELMLAAQAVELAHPSQLGLPMQRAYECVRDLSPPLVEDRPLGGDLKQLAQELLAERRLLQEVESAL